MALEEYRRKRRFEKTPEPVGPDQPTKSRDRSPLKFYVQKHNARNLHYDLRLEMDGVLKSWAVPKGPSLDPKDKRLAVHVEDHPMEYGDFEGVIPAGEYGAGAVIVWDAGTWYAVEEDGYASGDFKFILEGSKLRGQWMLVHTGRRGGDPKHWLWFKERDEEARPVHEFNVIGEQPRSVLSGRSIEEIEACPPAVWSTHTGRREATAAGDRLGAAVPAALQREALAVVAGARPVDCPKQPRPLLPTTTKMVPAGDDWLHEIKYDGYRMLALKQDQTVRLLSRNGRNWTDKLPKLAAEIACLPISAAILDGEIVVHDEDGTTSFQMLQNRIRRGDDRELCYFVFDLLYAEGFDLTQVALDERKALLRTVFDNAELPSIHFSQHIVGDGLMVFEKAATMGVEGIVSKKSRSKYLEGRSSDWLKKKFLENTKFTVVGYTVSRAQPFGALLVARVEEDGELVYMGRVGTGFSDQTLEELSDALKVRGIADCPLRVCPEKERGRQVRWVRPELAVEVEYAGLTGDGLLRFPAFRGIHAEPQADSDSGAAKLAAPIALDFQALAQLPHDKLANLKLTHPGRIMYPEQGITKLDVVTYYAQVASNILPHLADRPLSLFRCPEGVEGQGFFQKQPPKGLPDAVDQVELQDEDGSTKRVMRIVDAAGLLALVQFSVLEFHIGAARLDRLDRPEHVVFDLDPDTSVDWSAVLSAAVEVRDLLATLGLVSFVKTSGGKGLHVVVPLRRRSSWDDVFAFSRGVAKTLSREHPRRFVATISKSARKGRIYVDYLRNKPAATAIAPFSTRAHASAAVAMPFDWEELASVPSSNAWTLTNVSSRLPTAADAWEGFFDLQQSLTKKIILAVS